MSRRKWRFSPKAQLPRIDDADVAGALDTLRQGLIDIERYGRPRQNLTVTHPYKLMEIQQALDAELAKLGRAS